ILAIQASLAARSRNGSRNSMTSGSAEIAANGSASSSRHSRSNRRGVRSAIGTSTSSRLLLSSAAPCHLPTHLIEKHLLQLLEAFEPGGQPGFQHGLRV